ncbi:hypothetical protein FRC11_010230 [Ceratobasidium sp. 423]|nr:hypothetical protein FRC11_010230 [Ceratobasidium sp. 423]
MAVPAVTPTMHTLDQDVIAPVRRFFHSIQDPFLSPTKVIELVNDLTIDDERRLAKSRRIFISLVCQDEMRRHHAPTDSTTNDSRNVRQRHTDSRAVVDRPGTSEPAASSDFGAPSGFSDPSADRIRSKVPTLILPYPHQQYIVPWYNSIAMGPWSHSAHSAPPAGIIQQEQWERATPSVPPGYPSYQDFYDPQTSHDHMSIERGPTHAPENVSLATDPAPSASGVTQMSAPSFYTQQSQAPSTMHTSMNQSVGDNVIVPNEDITSLIKLDIADWDVVYLNKVALKCFSFEVDILKDISGAKAIPRGNEVPRFWYEMGQVEFGRTDAAFVQCLPRAWRTLSDTYFTMHHIVDLPPKGTQDSFSSLVQAFKSQLELKLGSLAGNCHGRFGLQHISPWFDTEIGWFAKFYEAFYGLDFRPSITNFRYSLFYGGPRHQSGAQSNASGVEPGTDGVQLPSAPISVSSSRGSQSRVPRGRSMHSQVVAHTRSPLASSSLNSSRPRAAAPTNPIAPLPTSEHSEQESQMPPSLPTNSHFDQSRRGILLRELPDASPNPSTGEALRHMTHHDVNMVDIKRQAVSANATQSLVAIAGGVHERSVGNKRSFLLAAIAVSGHAIETHPELEITRKLFDHVSEITKLEAQRDDMDEITHLARLETRGSSTRDELPPGAPSLLASRVPSNPTLPPVIPMGDQPMNL